MDKWKKFIQDRKIGQEEEKIYEEQYKDIKLLQIIFPEFWQNAYKKKNNFFHHVYAEAKQHVDFGICGKEWLEKDRCKELWHRHCDFCWKKINIDIQGRCYCSEDIELWICAECFNTFKEHFEWTYEKVQDISAESIANTVGIIIAKK